MGAIIRLVCFIKTKKIAQIQYKILLFSRLIMNIMHCFLLCFPNYIKCFARVIYLFSLLHFFIYKLCLATSYIRLQ